MVIKKNDFISCPEYIIAHQLLAHLFLCLDYRFTSLSRFSSNMTKNKPTYEELQTNLFLTYFFPISEPDRVVYSPSVLISLRIVCILIFVF